MVSQPRTGRYRVDVRARQAQAGPDNAILRISFGGVIQERAIPSTSFQTYSVEVNLTSGAQLLTLVFTNDFFADAANDRNVFIERVIVTSIP